MKRIISLLLTMVLAASLISLPQSAEAAESISTEALFMTYPTYLSNSEMDEGLAKASEAYYAVINSYSDADETLAAYMTAFSEGVSLLLKEGASKLGWTESMYEQYAREAATKYMQSMLTDENTIKKASKSVETAYKTLKTSYSVASSVDKTIIEQDLFKIATDYDISITKSDMKELVNGIYDSGTLKSDLKAIGASMDLWKYVLEFTEIHAIEMKTMDLLLAELENAGQTNSDLYFGLTLLKKDINKNPAHYVLERYGTKHILKFLSGKIDDLIAMVGGTAGSLITTFTKLFADYVYVNAKADDIAQAIMQTSFVSSIDICLSQYRLKFLQGKGTTADIETYEQLYGAYLSAIKCTLDSCYDISKIEDKFSLGGDCMIWSSNIETLYTYDKYIEWCKKEVAHDIENATLDTSGNSTITDALNEETIAAQLERIYKLYPPNAGETWNGYFDGTTDSLGFVAKMFNHIFDKLMCAKVKNDYPYILASNKNVRLIGMLEEEGVTTDALKELFANARIGDIVITSGQYDDIHAMILTEVTDTGIVVYDCGSEYAEDSAYNRLIRKYELSFTKMADAFSTNGKYTSKPGLSVYRAIKKINTSATTSTSSSLYYEEYDDSVNYVINNGVLTGYTGSRTTLEIPNGVTEIAANCFKNNTSIKYVYMPDTITTIGSSAFYGCTNLRYVDLSNALTAINESTFYNCKSLGGIIIPNTVTSIGDEAFFNCVNLTDVNISSSVTYLGGGAFGCCTSLNNIKIPKTLLQCNVGYYLNGICGGPFFKCSSLKNVEIESGITKIPQNLFRYCTGIEEIIIPDTVTEIGDRVFQGCDTLSKITLSKNISILEDSLFEGCSSLKSFNMTDNIKEIKPYVFYNCTGLEEITLSKNISYIPNNAFNLCKSLKTITIPNGVLKIDNHAFRDCESLENIDLPDSLQTIENHAFYGNKALKKTVIPHSVTSIGSWAFEKCDLLESIEFSEGLKTIGEGVCYECKSLKEIDIPESVTSIGSSAFENCDAMTKAVINSSGSIGSKAFYDCDALESIEMGDGITSIGANMCYGCDSLKEIKFGKYITTIPDSAFRLCASLETVTLPRYCQTVASNAFAEDTKLTTAYIMPYTTSIQDNSFSYPAKMTIYGKSGSYAETYANSRGIAFNGTTAPITSMAYTDDEIYIAKSSYAQPNMQIMPEYSTDTIAFISDNTNVVTVSDTGKVYGKAYGTANVTALSESGILKTVKVTVVKPATSITLNKAGLELAANTSEKLTATLSASDSNDVIEWSSDNEAVAMVDKDGNVTGISQGSATITAKAKFGNKTATCLVTVVASGAEIVDVTGVELSPATKDVPLGNAYTLKAIISPENATNKNVVWTSSNTNVATVENGVVTAKSLGTTTITVKTLSGNYTAICKITVVPKIEFTAFNVNIMGAYGLVNIQTANVPTTATVYVTSYSEDGELCELQRVTLSSGSAQTIVSTEDIKTIKAFVWEASSPEPLCEAAVYEIIK